MIQRERHDYNPEKQILINLILDTEYCNAVLPYIEERYFKSNYAKTLIEWIKDYHGQYSQAPKHQIEIIFESTREYIDPDIAEQIGNTLEYLSELSETENHNTDYLIDTAIEFLDERHTTLQVNAADKYLADGNILKAKEALAKQLQLKSTAFEWVEFDNDVFVRDCVRRMVVQADLDEAFFAFNGRLGEFVGPIDKGWFIAFFAPAKRGKTTYMMQTLVAGMMRGLNVVFLSLEMPIHQLFIRYLLYTIGEKPEQKERTVMTPIMDCMHNQDGSCELDARSNAGCYGAVVESDGTRLAYEDIPDWKPCTECRGTTAIKPTAWKVPVEKQAISEGEYIKLAKKYNDLYGRKCRAIHIPSKTATVNDLKAEVELLRQRENFIPDMIVIDYADLIKPDNADAKRHELDDIWEQLRAWGQTDRVLVVSASQTNRLSADAEYMKATHVAEDWSKAAKVDVAIGLCQSDDMKELGLMNLNKVLHRHAEFVESHVCTVLQELTHQQSDLDSEFVAM